MERRLFTFAVFVTGGLTLVLSRPAESQRAVIRLAPIVVSTTHVEVPVSADTLRRGENLAQLLDRQALSGEEAAAAVEALRVYANPRTLRPGLAVAVERTVWDEVKKVVVRIDVDNEIELEPARDVWIVRLRPLPVQIDTVLLKGDIKSSLYSSVMSLSGAPIDAQERIEQVMWGIYRPFQWTIDFGLDLREGDEYRAVYERVVRADGSLKSGRVLAVEFTNRGRTHSSYWFEPRKEYFDAQGKSMKQVFLKAPVDFNRISSRFARKRYHPMLGRYRAHEGVDYAADQGTPVYTTATGRITRAGWWGGYGNMIEVRHINGYVTRYAHLSFVVRGLNPGLKVVQGQKIGYVGSTGLATGPHLHYELRHGRKAVDPYSVNLPSGEAIEADEKIAFKITRDRLRRRLDGDRVPEPRLLAE